ncbi:ATP-binding protein [Streptomyces sp. NPDC008222]|uniref:sensor histidine kinase n=1 Tax=Streptomyces sp. NPDC008222 TaxID=3364820 RepID=UPI0036E21D44
MSEIVGQLSELQSQAAAALVRVHEESQSAVLLGMVRHLSRREHALVERALRELNALQKLTDDPMMLNQMFTIDHLVTRMRRLVESKAVLGGESLRSIREPMNVETLLRGACSEVMAYERVERSEGAAGVELGLPGHVGPDVSHVLAELIENGLEFSDPSKKVQVRAERVAAGLAIEVEDRTMLMTPELRARVNDLLANPDAVDVSAQIRDGQIGLLTAAKIARRHGLAVRLSPNVTGGVTAMVVVPTRHLVALRKPAAAPASGERPAPAPPRPAPAPAGVGPVQAHRSAPVSAATAPADSSLSVPGVGGSAGAPPLPQRTPTRIPLSDAAPQPQIPPSASRAGMAAAFHKGRQAARASAPPADDRGGQPPAHA